MKLQENNALITKKFFLDWSKWRCGNNGDNMLGKGLTEMRNSKGFYCCLGLCSLQLGIHPRILTGKAAPSDIKKEIPGLNYFAESYWMETALADRAIEINDDQKTTPEQKIELLQELFATEGYEIEVINKPV